jgi:hypothetical protein
MNLLRQYLDIALEKLAWIQISLTMCSTGQNQQDDPDFNGFSKATFILNPGKETNEVHLYIDKSTMLKSQDYMPFLLQSFDQLDSTHF